MKKYIVLIVLSLFPFISMAKNIVISEGQSEQFITSQDIGSVFISDPEVADYQVIDNKKVVVYGKKVGTSSFMIFNDAGQTIRSSKITVNKNMASLESLVKAIYPDANVKISSIGELVVLTGSVYSEREKDGIYAMVGESLAKELTIDEFVLTGENTEHKAQFMESRSYANVINNIEVLVTKQVNVKLSIAEVSQSFLEQIGADYSTPDQIAGVFVNPLLDISASNIVSVITAIGDESIGQVLAEPNLSVVSGESASFLVGGELPVVTTIDGASNVEYKEFGVRLDLLAKVKQDDKISLALMPEVSSLDVQYSNEEYDLPSLKTRKARTTVELADGESFILGGLLNTENRESLSKIPLIGDIPIIGSLFRNSSTERNKTELIIVATVNLVKPVATADIQLPKIQETTTLERFFGVENDYLQAKDQWLEELLSTGGFKDE
ncbi:type II and III secretion system protein family protein [Vibrio paucivorans]